MEAYFKGEIYYIYEEKTSGCEQKAGRPGIIVSNDVGNEFSKIVEVVFLTTREKKPLPTHVDIYTAPKPSIALCEQIHTISKDRIGQYINTITQNELKELERAMLVSLGINCNVKGSKKLEAWEKLIEEMEHSETEIIEVVKEQELPKTEEVEQFPTEKQEQVNIETSLEYVRVCAERDVYKELVMRVLERKKKTA